MNDNDLNDKYEKRRIKRFSLKNQGVEILKKSCDGCSILSWLLSFFPFLIWIKNYSIKSYLIPDIISGFTISVLHIPQGLAYGLLAGVGAINGLYVSFFPVLIYFFMGTSRHISIGMLNIVRLTFQYKKLPNIALISKCMQKRLKFKVRLVHALMSAMYGTLNLSKFASRVYM